MTAATPRRQVLALGAAGAVTAATGCTVYGDESNPPASTGTPSGGGENGDSDADGDTGADANGEAVANTSDVEVGGGLILSDQQLVITQPTEGQFRGFSAVCTHQGCAVNSVSDGTINCPCHGSQFSVEDGSVIRAAAGLTPDSQDSLPEVNIAVDRDQISIV